jgi:endonuclease/exonuclease/phosphatase family metal-dependent hydrolase
MSKPSRAKIALLAALCTAALGLAAPPSQAADTGVDRMFRTLDFNFCGWACDFPDDDTVGGGTQQEKVDELVGKIRTWKPQVVFLNEVCLSTVQAVTDALANDTDPDTRMWAGAATASGAPTGFSADNQRICDTDPDTLPNPTVSEPAGDAILVRRATSISNPVQYDIRPGDVPGQNRPMLCVSLDDAPYNTAACVTHVNLTEESERIEEIRLIALRAIQTYPGSSGNPVVVGGDFNFTPDDAGLDHMYVGGGKANSVFEETDQCATRAGHVFDNPPGAGCNEYTKDKGTQAGGEVSHNKTYDRKIDYTFLRQAYFNPNVTQSTVNHSSFSDHGFLLGQSRQCSFGGAGSICP